MRRVRGWVVWGRRKGGKIRGETQTDVEKPPPSLALAAGRRYWLGWHRVLCFSVAQDCKR